MEQQESGRAWARRVFGGAALGDERWTKRLVRLAESAADRPGGKATHVCRTSGDRQGAYDLLNSERFGEAGESCRAGGDPSRPLASLRGGMESGFRCLFLGR